MTNQQGAPEALRPIARYKIGYATDSWGDRSSTPGGIQDPAGGWVRYEDHVAALQAQRPAPSVAVALSDDLRDRLVAISEAIADQDDRAAQAMLREILAAPQPSPTPQAASSAVLKAIREANMQLVRTGDDEFMLVTYKNAKAQCDGGQCGIGGYCDDCPMPKADSQPAPVEVADAMADSQYLAGVSAGWNAANADDPNAALQKLHESRAGYLKPLRAARAQADSQPAPTDWYEGITEKHFDLAIHKAVQRDRAARAAPQPPAAAQEHEFASEDVQRFAIEVEKALCAALGIKWAPSGMSIATLIERLKNAQQPAPDEAAAMSRTRDLAEAGRWPSDWVEAYRRGYSDRAASTPADSVTAPAGVAYLDIGAGGYIDLGTDLSNEALSRLPKGRHVLIIAGTYGIDGYTPTPPAQAADSVLEDAARLDWLALAGPTSICVVIDRPNDGEVEVATDDVTGYGKTLREALDAARKQGGS